MNQLSLYKKQIASFFLLLCFIIVVQPINLFALTTGPSQPEMRSFEIASNHELVDPATGAFTYNNPLLEIGGYPVNLSYHSGAGMDDESSWVGFGWNLNPGSIERQMRGLPDDFRGDMGIDADAILREQHLKPDITGGINFSLSPEVFGFDIGKIAKAQAQAGIFYNNKRGIGVELGLDINAPLLGNNRNTATTNTAGLAAGVKLAFNSQNGASFNPNINLAVSAKNRSDLEVNTTSLGLGASMNSRSGLQYFSLGTCFNTTTIAGNASRQITGSGGSIVSYVSPSFLPQVQPEFFNESYAISPQFGPEAWGFFAGMQLTGHYSKQTIANKTNLYKAYGYLNSSKGKNDPSALLDFNREKDVPYFDGVPHLPIPIATPDIFTATAQDGSCQFRAFSGGAGIFFDHKSLNTGISASLGIEAGGGAGFKIGGDLSATISKTVTGKWNTGKEFLYDDQNVFTSVGDFYGSLDSQDPQFEPCYFKAIGEKLIGDRGFENRIANELPIRVKIEGNQRGTAALNAFELADGSVVDVSEKLIHQKRQKRNKLISYLSAGNARLAGLDRKIVDYYKSARGFKPFLDGCASGVEAAQPFKKDHHFGEITITEDNGSRKVYGLPVYNTHQEDVSFSIDPKFNIPDRKTGLVSFTPTDASVANNVGMDQFYSKEVTPAYAHSFLLTGILSADYVDLTHDGITDDDLGTAVKFNYWRKTDNYQWRTPYAEGMANFNEGFISDDKDDRANYSYGAKELWYLHSIESRTMVAVFETEDREDGLGADRMGAMDLDKSHRQQVLTAVRLFSKHDWKKFRENAVSIKTIHFVYDYSLFAGSQSSTKRIPNNSGNDVTNSSTVLSNLGGKLTLKKIYFTYETNSRGILQPYLFDYANNHSYQWRQYDRWGNYKNENDDNPRGVPNIYYPYSTQNKVNADANAKLWQLTSIQTPAGGNMRIDYESGDYRYVQDKVAMEMYPIAGFNALNQSSGYYTSEKILVKLPVALNSNADLRNKYFGGDNPVHQNIFFKARVRLKNGVDKFDFVSGYAEIENVQKDVQLFAGQNNIAEIRFKKIKGEGTTREYNPIAKSAWQFMRLNTPALVYPGYNVRDDLAPVQFVKALLGAISSIAELIAPFDSRAELHKLAPEIDLEKSWIRLESTTCGNDPQNSEEKICYRKLGGAARVKEIDFSDEWHEMSKSSAETAHYGLVYDYTTEGRLPGGEKIIESSGVASFEPLIGNEENPFHQPIAYQQNIKLGPDNAYFLDEPLCESLFPAASICYSRVTLRHRGSDGRIGETGSTVNEYYTEKDFPVRVSHTGLNVQSFGGSSILQLLSIKKNDSRVVSEGYSIELNDMNCKPKSEQTFDRSGQELSAVLYEYKTLNAGSAQPTLDNNADVILSDGNVINEKIGEDVEMYTDMRSESSMTAGVNVLVNIDALYLLFAVIPVPVVLPLPNFSHSGFRSAVTVKTITRYGILNKIIKRQNGAQNQTTNLAWDAETGLVLLTQTENEFGDPVYDFKYPSHWLYNMGMGHAYSNAGTVLPAIEATKGKIRNIERFGELVTGDEFIVTNGSAGAGKRFWLNNLNPGKEGAQLAMIDEIGELATFSGSALLVRSGHRNMQSVTMGTIRSLVRPIANNHVDIGAASKILNATATAFDDEWPIKDSRKRTLARSCPAGYREDSSGRCFIDIQKTTTPSYNINTSTITKGSALYSTCGTFLTNLENAYLKANAADPAHAVLVTPDIWQNGSRTCSSGRASEEAGPLNRCGIWIQGKSSDNYFNQWIGIRSKFYLGTDNLKNKSENGKTGYLYLGFGGQNSIEVYIDDVLVAARSRNNDNASSSPMRTWRLKPVSLSLDRQHEILIKVKNEVSGGEGAIGVELYDNTYTQLRNAVCLNSICLPCNYCSSCRTASDVSPSSPCNESANIIWSSKCLLGKKFNYHSTSAGKQLTDFDAVCNGKLFTDADCNLLCTSTTRSYAEKEAKPLCVSLVGSLINPYALGVRGNWRIKNAFNFRTSRVNVTPYIVPGEPDVLEKTDIRRSGFYDKFNPFWDCINGQWIVATYPFTSDRWLTTSRTFQFGITGQEAEKSDVLNRFTSVLYGYNNSAMTAAVENASTNEIVFDGFEDYPDTGGCRNQDSCNLSRGFSALELLSRYPTQVKIVESLSHSGWNALHVSDHPVSITKSVFFSTPGKPYFINANQMFLSEAGIMHDFNPRKGVKYLLSVWIKDDGVDDRSSTVQLLPGESEKSAIDVLAGTSRFSTLKAGPRVEGWRKVETIFTVPDNVEDISFQFRPGYFDDLRICPFDAEMKSYVYDIGSMRLLAELDENNFATFYEYDDEGLLTRMKKETERGIMTLKESRSAYRSN